MDTPKREMIRTPEMAKAALIPSTTNHPEVLSSDKRAHDVLLGICERNRWTARRASADIKSVVSGEVLPAKPTDGSPFVEVLNWKDNKTLIERPVDFFVLQDELRRSGVDV